jgi:hypothetical protein
MSNRIGEFNLQINKKKMEKKLILSRIQTPDGTILTSHHRHDYVQHVDKNGETYILDGGSDYQRVSINTEPFIDFSVWSDAPYEIIRQNYYRGGRGKNGDQPVKWVAMSDMSDEWLANCIEYNNNLGMGKSFANEMYRKELDYRKENNIQILDQILD